MTAASSRASGPTSTGPSGASIAATYAVERVEVGRQQRRPGSPNARPIGRVSA